VGRTFLRVHALAELYLQGSIAAAGLPRYERGSWYRVVVFLCNPRGFLSRLQSRDDGAERCKPEWESGGLKLSDNVTMCNRSRWHHLMNSCTVRACVRACVRAYGSCPRFLVPFFFLYPFFLPPSLAVKRASRKCARDVKLSCNRRLGASSEHNI